MKKSSRPKNDEPSTVLASVYRRGGKRAFWLGFSLFGWVYMALTADAWWQLGLERSDLPTTRVLTAIFPYFDSAVGDAGIGFTGGPRGGGSVSGRSSFFQSIFFDADAPNRQIRLALEQPVAMPFATETPLRDVIKHIQAATTSPAFRQGIPIYVDTVGLQWAEKTMDSDIVFEMDSVPLRTSLKLLMEQLDLAYHVEDGLLKVTSKPPGPLVNLDAFQRIGHCWLAWLMGLIGGWAAMFLRATGIPKPAPTAAPTRV